MPWPRRARLSEVQLKRDNDGLRTTIVCLKREIENKAGHVQRLEALLCSRLQTIDELNAKLEQARAQTRKLAAMVADQQGARGALIVGD
jgi:chromosome segregation ATPase